MLENSDVSVRKTRRSIAALLGDAPELALSPESLLVPSFLGSEPVSCREGAKEHTGTQPLVLDPGPGRFAATLVFASCAATLLSLFLMLTSTMLWVKAFKPLRDLHRSIDYHDHKITSADLNPTNDELIVTTAGGGVHRVNTKTFRTLTEMVGSTGLSSPNLSGVAVRDDGVIAVTTNEAAGNSGPGGASGVDVLGRKGWRTLIAATGIPDMELKAGEAARALGTDKIQFVSAIGADKAILTTTGRVLVYHSGKRRLFERSPKDEASRLAGAEIAAVAAMPSASAGLALAVKEAGKPSRVKLLSFLGEDSYSVADTGQLGDRVSPELVVQLAFAGNTLWAKTQGDRLYSRESDGWKLRIDGASELDLSRIRHLVLVPGPDNKSALWLTEVGAGGDVESIRVRMIDEGSGFPLDPCARIGRRGQAAEVGKPGALPPDLRLGSKDASPVAWFDSRRDEPSLLVPAAKAGGIYRFYTGAGLPASPSNAALSVELIQTPKYQVLGIDLVTRSEAGRDELLLLLEREDRPERLCCGRDPREAEELWRGGGCCSTAGLPARWYGACRRQDSHSA